VTVPIDQKSRNMSAALKSFALAAILPPSDV